MISYRMTNAIIEGDKIRVFVEFSNGNVFSNLFVNTASLIEIAGWCDAQVARFEENERIAQENLEQIGQQIQIDNGGE